MVETRYSNQTMEAHIHLSIKMLEDEKKRLLTEIEDIEKRIQTFKKMLPNEPMPQYPPILLEETDAWGCGEPPVPGAIPARTMRDQQGNIRVLLCRSNAGEGWIYTPVADGWVVVSQV